MYRLQLCSHPFGDRDTLHHEPSALGLPADVREPQEIKRLRSAQSPRLPVCSGEPPKLYQSRLLGLQLQPKLCESHSQVSLKPLRFLTMLKSQHKIVSLCRTRHKSA